MKERIAGLVLACAVVFLSATPAVAQTSSLSGVVVDSNGGILPGVTAPRALLVRAPWFTRFDIGVTKRFPIQGSMNFELRVDVLNVFDNVNFDPFDYTTISNTLNTAYTSANFGQVTTAYQDSNNTFDPGGRLGQIMFRFNW